MHAQDSQSGGRPGVVAILAAAVAWSLPAASHHSFSALQTPEGEDAVYAFVATVRAFRILNPHGALIIDTVDEAGNSDAWLIELSPAAPLAREGWHDDLVAPGDAVMVSIFSAVTPNRARLRALQIPGDAGASRSSSHRPTAIAEKAVVQAVHDGVAGGPDLRGSRPRVCEKPVGLASLGANVQRDGLWLRAIVAFAFCGVRGGLRK